MFSEETSVFSVECYFTVFSDIAKTGSGSSRALSELVEFIFPLPYVGGRRTIFSPNRPKGERDIHSKLKMGMESIRESRLATS